MHDTLQHAATQHTHAFIRVFRPFTLGTQQHTATHSKKLQKTYALIDIPRPFTRDKIKFTDPPVL